MHLAKVRISGAHATAVIELDEQAEAEVAGDFHDTSLNDGAHGSARADVNVDTAMRTPGAEQRVQASRGEATRYPPEDRHRGAALGDALQHDGPLHSRLEGHLKAGDGVRQ